MRFLFLTIVVLVMAWLLHRLRVHQHREDALTRERDEQIAFSQSIGRHAIDEENIAQHALDELRHLHVIIEWQQSQIDGLRWLNTVLAKQLGERTRS